MRVYEGKELHIDNLAMLDIVVQAGFTHSTASAKGGKSMIHLSKNLIPWRTEAFCSCWGMARLKPWIADFERLLHMSYDSGLRQQWMTKAR